MVLRDVEIMEKLIINGELPDLNKVIRLSKKHWSKYSGLKRRHTNRIAVLAKAELQPVEVYPVAISFDWHCKDKRKDCDNIAHGKKYIIDGLVTAGILKDDSFKCVAELHDRFFVDRENPRIEVIIQEGMIKDVSDDTRS